jgi:RimJ/RimL family protein N-acetyltransferase
LITLGPTLKTERLILRPPEQLDLDAFAALLSDEEAARHIGGVKDRSASWRLLAGTVGSWVLKGFGMFSVIEKQSNEWVGQIGPLNPPDWPGTEVGWMLARPYWGKGYAYEAAAACMDFAVDQLGWQEIIHCIDQKNEASQKLATRLGSRTLRQAVMPMPYQGQIADIWGQTREDWLNRKR